MHRNSHSGVLSVVHFEGEGFRVDEQLQDVWPFLETGRCLKTFDTLEHLGEGGCGSVNKVKHKVDGVAYALKTI